MAMADGTDVAAAAAGITLMRGDPALVPAALDIAARTHARIWQGLFWACAYNIVGIPLAAAGLLSPVVSGATKRFGEFLEGIRFSPPSGGWASVRHADGQGGFVRTGSVWET